MMRDIDFLPHLVVFAVLLLMIFLLSGCSGGYKEVLIPTKCEIPKRDKPIQKGSELEQLKSVLIYTEGLERDLNFCRSE